jgi:hypothetical protein
MEDLTYKKIRARKKLVLQKLNINGEKLKEYRYVDELHELKTGGFIRWVNVNNPSKLMNGGFVVRVDIEEDGIQILCKNSFHFFQFWFDECFVFQKITPQEHALFLANAFAE